MFCRKRQKDAKGKTEADSPASNGPRAQGVGAENHHHSIGHGSRPLASSQPRNHRVSSSNAQTYDRSHVTGASSSTASSHGIRPGPPPSPSYTMRTEQHYPEQRVQVGHHHHHHSTHSLGRSSHRSHHYPQASWQPRDQSTLSHHHRIHNNRRKNDPPPTPASTEYEAYEESESSYRPHYGGHGSHFDHRGHHGHLVGGYDSENYGVSQHYPPARAHPPTPRSQDEDYSDVGIDQEVDYYHHRYNEGSPFIQPPPTRCGSPRQTTSMTLEEDNDDQPTHAKIHSDT